MAVPRPIIAPVSSGRVGPRVRDHAQRAAATKTTARRSQLIRPVSSSAGAIAKGKASAHADLKSLLHRFPNAPKAITAIYKQGQIMDEIETLKNDLAKANEALKAANDKAVNLKAELDKAHEKLAAHEEQIKAQRKDAIIAKITSLIEAKRVKAESKDALIALFEASADAGESFIAALPEAPNAEAPRVVGNPPVVVTSSTPPKGGSDKKTITQLCAEKKGIKL